MGNCELKLRTKNNYRKSLELLQGETDFLFLISTLVLELETQATYFQTVSSIYISQITLYYNKYLCIQNFMISSKKLNY